MLVFWFSSLAMTAVRKAASSVITEVRRQFREKPGIMQGTEEPDYASCVDIVTVGALKAMVLPGALVVLFPIVRSEEHTSELQSHVNLVCRLLLEKKKTNKMY